MLYQQQPAKDNLSGEASLEAFRSRMDLACPLCRKPLCETTPEKLSCRQCERHYPQRLVEGRFQPDLRPYPPEVEARGGFDETEAWQNRIKMFLRRFPGLYRFLVYTIGTALLLPPTSQQFVNRLGAQKKVLCVGAGVLRLKGDNVTHLDYETYPHLEVVGDAHHLPFADNTFDGVICESLLEHVQEPWAVIAEMGRVLRPGGKIYLLMPFMLGFHAAPNDFYRFTHRGMEYQMRHFKKDELKAISGPASALTSVLVELMAMLFSLGSKTLYRLFTLVFLVLLAPLKVLDFILCLHPEAIRVASVILYIGSKPEHTE